MNVRSMKQTGSALAISLIFLLMLTFVGLSAIQTSTLQERMAGNSRDVNLAFQASEAAVRSAEVFLQSATLPDFNGANGRYQVCEDAESNSVECNPPDWKDLTSTGWVNVPEIDGANQLPQYYIQKYISVYDQDQNLAADEPPQFVDIYRVVARGFGQSDQSVVAIETTYRRD